MQSTRLVLVDLIGKFGTHGAFVAKVDMLV